MDTPRTLIEAVRYFSNADNCREYLVARRWPKGVTCPTCGSDGVYFDKTRQGWICKTKHPMRKFSLKTGTIFEDSPLGLDKWLPVVWMIANMKNGVSSWEVHRSIGVTQKTAWFMLQRIRLAMQDETGGKLSGTVEVDETYVGGKARGRPSKKEAAKARYENKLPVVALVQRGGDVRAMVMPTVNAKNLREVIRSNVHQGARLMTDEASYYKGIGKEFEGGHETVVHSRGEYVRGDATTNSVEGFFSLLQRGIYGVFHSVSEQHLHRYVSEFQYKYNTRHLNDGERVSLAIQKSEGKRLRYKDPIQNEH